MFFEDLSNPKYISDKVSWMFPFVKNFYGLLNKSSVSNNYVSRKLPISSLTSNALIEIPSSIKDLSKDISIEFFNEDTSYIVLAKPVSIRNGVVDYYKIEIPQGVNVSSYKVRISCALESIKIYGL